MKEVNIHIAYITNGLPYPGNNGVPMLGWSLVKYICQKGHKVSVVGLCEEGDLFCNHKTQEMIKALGAQLDILSYSREIPKQLNFFEKVLRVIKPLELKTIYPTIKLTNEIAEIIILKKFDIIIAVHIEALAAIGKLKQIPCLGIMGDPKHLPLFYYWLTNKNNYIQKFKEGLDLLKCALILPEIETEFLRNCLGRGAVAAHYADWFKNRGIPDCQYFHIPINDELGKDWRTLKNQQDRNKKIKIILLGALNGTATRVGLKFLVRKCLSHMDKILGKNNYEIHIIGMGEWPEEVEDISGKDNIKLRGYVDDLKKELLTADIFLVPTPIPLGIRVRILTALSYGMCIISHQANAKGIPELKNDENCILFRSGKELAIKIKEVMVQKEFKRKLEENARKTFEAYFSEDVAAKKIFDRAVEISQINE